MEDRLRTTELLTKASGYLESRLQLAKLKMLNKSLDVIANATARLVIIMMSVFFILMLSIGLALFIGDKLGKFYYGFLLVAAFYLMLSILVYLFRQKWIKGPIKDFAIKKILN